LNRIRRDLPGIDGSDDTINRNGDDGGDCGIPRDERDRDLGLDVDSNSSPPGQANLPLPLHNNHIGTTHTYHTYLEKADDNNSRDNSLEPQPPGVHMKNLSTSGALTFSPTPVSIDSANLLASAASHNPNSSSNPSSYFSPSASSMVDGLGAQKHSKYALFFLLFVYFLFVFFIFSTWCSLFFMFCCC
jgi:hypothetical protein